MKNLRNTSDENRSQLLRFLGLACSYSDRLHTLHIEGTQSIPEDGDAFMESLANSAINTIKSLTISKLANWFADERQDCIAPLIALLSLQNQLEINP